MDEFDPNLWDLITVDNTEIYGCYQQTEFSTFSRVDGETVDDSKCWLIIPKCQPCLVRIYCGSQVSIPCVGQFTVGNQGTVKDPSCFKWYLDEECETCG